MAEKAAKKIISSLQSGSVLLVFAASCQICLRMEITPPHMRLLASASHLFLLRF